ncbi:hypothetical protein [Novosphingobium colocasiae]|uniref:hypothetical protein n=1 Tax=Novosphingobium colocasiae TaxID=1256513 RepID=UPI0035B0576C
MQIEIDFDVFKALTAQRENEDDTYNAVIRRLLKLPAPNALVGLGLKVGQTPLSSSDGNSKNAKNTLASFSGGAWFDNIHFPEGTQFSAIYKGETYTAQIKDGCWVNESGIVSTSPSAAAGAISNTNVNGWRFWYFKRPGDREWMRMDTLKA